MTTYTKKYSNEVDGLKIDSLKKSTLIYLRDNLKAFHYDLLTTLTIDDVETIRETMISICYSNFDEILFKLYGDDKNYNCEMMLTFINDVVELIESIDEVISNINCENVDKFIIEHERMIEAKKENSAVNIFNSYFNDSVNLLDDEFNQLTRCYKAVQETTNSISRFHGLLVGFKLSDGHLSEFEAFESWFENNSYKSPIPSDEQPVTIATVIKSPLRALINKDSRIKSCHVCNGGFDYYLIFTDNSKMFMSCGSAGAFVSTKLSSIDKLIKNQKFEKVI